MSQTKKPDHYKITAEDLKNQEDPKQVVRHMPGEKSGSIFGALFKSIGRALMIPFAAAGAIYTGAIKGVLMVADAVTTEFKKKFGSLPAQINNSLVDSLTTMATKVFNFFKRNIAEVPLTEALKEIRDATKTEPEILRKQKNPNRPLDNIPVFGSSHDLAEYDSSRLPSPDPQEPEGVPAFPYQNFAHKGRED